MGTGGTNYEEIRQDNLERYGWDRGFWGPLLSRVYSHRTHFIFELLQNAEDAHHVDGRGASKVEFILERDRLVVIHDGCPFTEQNVRAICRVGRGTKGEDDDSIGKFGIGFKSVYAYTKQPAVHCPPEHFRIIDFVDPHEVEPADPGAGWTTRFEFPFDADDVTAQQSYSQIRAALADLTPRALLFLQHLRRVDWADADGNGGLLELSPKKVDGVEVSSVVSHDRAAEDWVRFQVPHPDGVKASRPIELAFLLGTDGDGRRCVVPAAHTTVSTYFPTNRATQFGFLIQASFDVTPNREELYEDAEVNARIVDVAAKLLPDALETLRERGWLRGPSLEALPLSPRDFPKGDLFRPLMQAARAALRERALLPRLSGGWATAGKLRVPASKAVRELLSPAQLGKVLGEDHDVHWIASSVSKQTTPRLYECLFGYEPPYAWPKGPKVPPLVSNLEVRPERVLRGLSTEFLQSQPEEWIVSLYSFLSSQKAQREQLRGLPLVRLEDGSHVVPFGGNGAPRVWLPPDEPTTFPTVKRSLAQAPEARKFLRELGLSEPDLVDDVLASTLPQYDSTGEGFTRPGPDEQVKNLERIQKALQSDRSEKRELLLRELRKRTFIRTHRAGSDDLVWAHPAVVYRTGDPGFHAYAVGVPGIYLLDEDTSRFAGLWDALGLKEGVVVRYRPPGYSGHVSLVDRHGWHVRGRHGFDPDFEIEGLQHALTEPTVEKSLFIWSLAGKYAASIHGEVEESRNQHYDYSTKARRTSTAGALLMQSEWLPDGHGNYVRPANIGLEQLPEEFPRDESLASALGMLEPADREDIARTFGIEEDDVAILLENKEELPALVEEMRARKKRQGKARAGNGEDEPKSAAEHIAARQQAAGEEQEVDAPLPPSGPKTETSVQQAAKKSRAIPKEARLEVRQHIRTVLTGKAAEQKEEATVEVLADYAGRCQICRRTYLQPRGGHGCSVVQWQPAVADGGPTFAGNLLLVCAWHAALLANARFTLLGAKEVTPEELVTFVRAAELAEDLDGQRSYSVPVFFHNVADTDDARTETKRETIRFAEAHWLAFKLCVLGKES